MVTWVTSGSDAGSRSSLMLTLDRSVAEHQPLVVLSVCRKLPEPDSSFDRFDVEAQLRLVSGLSPDLEATRR